MITEVYFREGYYLYIQVGLSGRGERTSEKGAIGVPEHVSGRHSVGRTMGTKLPILCSHLYILVFMAILSQFNSLDDLLLTFS